MNETSKSIELWVKAYNSHDPDEIIQLYDETIKNTQFPWGKTVAGKSAMRETFVNVFQAFPDIEIVAQNLIESSPWIALEWNFKGTMKGTFAGHSPNGNTFNMSGCEVFKIENGLITNQHGYWDKETMFRQLKLM